MNIWNSYIWNEKRNVKKILAVINATNMQLRKEKAWKNQACRDSNPDLCDTGAALEPIELKSQLGAGHQIGLVRTNLMTSSQLAL